MQQGEALCSAAPMRALAIAAVDDLLRRYPKRERNPEVDGRLWRENNPL